MSAAGRITALAAILILAAGCGKKDGAGEDGTTDAVDEDAFVDIVEEGDDAPADVDGEEAVEPGPGDTFDRFCEGEEWDASLTPAAISELGGTYSGYYPGQPLGTVYVMKIIPEHPFHARTIRVAFAGGMGTARMRLMKTWGRSYPDLYAEEPGDLVEPIDLLVSSAGTDYWYEMDISDREVYLEPTQHYAIVYQQVEETMPTAPMPAVEELTEGDYSHALMIVPTSATPYGVDGNFRMQVAGDYFCAWEDAEHWFEEDVTQPFAVVNSSRASVADIDGDGHDDLVFNDGGPVAFLGDGAGDFADPGFDPFPDIPYADLVVFGDIDNDGDADAFAAANISPDADGDGTTKAEGDCDDGNANVNPFETEVQNGLDDDCDGVADEGFTDADRDADGDGVSITAGDCDDTNDEILPGAAEKANGVDDDCDGVADEGADVADTDGDGHTIAAGDCNDNVDTIHPGATETSNGLDDNCDGTADDGTDTADGDSDGHTIAAGDCNDTDDEVFPGATERANGVDDDCDGTADEGADAVDGDSDGHSIAAGDCNDNVASIAPGATEAGNAVDDDCDGTADEGLTGSDRDGDGYAVTAGDCDDTRDTTYPGAEELRDGRDNDCDGETDEDFVNRVLLNDGSGLFTTVVDAGVEVIGPTAVAAFGDGDGDGRLDVYWGNWLAHYPDPAAIPDVYMTGDGDGTFTDATVSAGMNFTPARACYGVLWTDYNNDGHQDVWVGNYGYGLNFLWHNNGDGTFTEMGDTLGLAQDDIGWQGGNTFGGDFGDFDNDGDMDNYAANIAHPRYQPSSDISTFNVNQGPPDYTFVNMREEYGFVYDEGDVNATFADYDNDMDLDIAVASLYTGHFSRLYRNDGADGFTDVTYETKTAVNDAVSVIWSDVDEDGDLDLVIADRRGAEKVHLFVNLVGQDLAWIQLVLQGTTTNHDAIGARVTLTAGGVTQLRDVKAGGGHNTQTTSVVHFGLGSETTIDSVTVSWVGGTTETITGLAPGGRYLVVEGSGTGTLVP